MKHFFYTIIAIFAITCQAILSVLSADNVPSHHDRRIIIKFAQSTPLYNEVKHVFQSTGVDAIQAGKVRVPTRLLSFITGSSIDDLRPLRENLNFEPTPHGLERLFLASITDSELQENALKILNARPDIESAEPDYIGYGGGQVCEKQGYLSIGHSHNSFPNDNFFAFQWGLKNDGQGIGGVNGIPGADINILDAWDITTGSPDFVLAVLDSGIPKSHPEFSGRLVEGYDFVNNNDDPEDDHGHGTSVASIAAATGNNEGVMAGVNWNVKVMPVKILNDQNQGFYSWWINGIEYAVDNGADVINMSVGGSGFSQPLMDAVNYALDNGVIVVACMMNENNDVTFYPAGYDGVISVGATNNRDLRAEPFCWGGGSNYGDHIDFAAPGERIVSLNYQDFNAAGFWCGTSQAAPMVAGVITLMLSINPELSRDEIYEILRETTREQVHLPAKISTSWDQYFGWGRIDAYAALDEVSRITSISDRFVERDLSDTYTLFQNYPNPFNPTTTIDFLIPEAGNVRITIYSILGSNMKTIVDGHYQSGRYSVTFDASDLPSGVYMYVIRTNDYIEARQMVYLK